jgi:hypothetical protein
MHDNREGNTRGRGSGAFSAQEAWASMPPRSRTAIVWASIQSFFGCYSPLPQTPHLRPSGTMRGPSQTERGRGQVHALTAVRQGRGQDAGVPGVSPGASTGAGRRSHAYARAGMTLAGWCIQAPAQEPLRPCPSQADWEVLRCVALAVLAQACVCMARRTYGSVLWPCQRRRRDDGRFEQLPTAATNEAFRRT